MKKMLRNVMVAGMMLWPIQEWISSQFNSSEHKKETIEMMVDDHNAIINEPIENIQKKYWLTKAIEVITHHTLIEINKKRAAVKANKLVSKPIFQKVAQGYADFLGENFDRYFDINGKILRDPHVQYNLDGTTWNVFDRLHNQWYKNYKYTGEIISYRHLTIKSIIEWRMKSLSHKENMLDNKYTQIGIGFSFENSICVVNLIRPKDIK